MTATRIFAALLCTLTLLAPLSAAADEPGKLFLGATSGFGGEFEGEFDTDAPFGFFDVDIDNEDMDPTWGGFLHFETPLHRLFALGARLGFTSFITEELANEDWSRNWALNVDLAPKLRFGVTGTPIELYAVAPVGLSVLFASEDWEDDDIEFDTGISWNLSVLGGAEFMLADDFGIFVEGGWMLQNVDWEGQTSDGTFDVALDGEFSQMVANLGLVLAM